VSAWFRALVQSEWAEIGGLGRTALIALGMSAAVAVVLAVAIPQQVERHLIDGEIRSLTRIAVEMEELGMIPPDVNDPVALAVLDELVWVNLLGSDTVRVKIWLSDGTIAYSDQPDLIGSSFVSAKPNTYLLRTGDELDALVQFDSYYCEDEEAGCITFRYRLIPSVAEES